MIEKKEKSFSLSSKFEEDKTAVDELFKGSLSYNITQPEKKAKFWLIEDKATGEVVAWYMKKKEFYIRYLQPKVPGAPKYLCPKLRDDIFYETLKAKIGTKVIKEPDGLLYNIKTNTLYIIEVKYQTEGMEGTAHEKVWGAGYLKYYYEQVVNYIDDTKPKVNLLYIVNNVLVNKYPDDYKYLRHLNIDYFVESYPKLEYFDL